MTRRSKPLTPCSWCRQVVDKHGERPVLTTDFGNARFHSRCFVESLVAARDRLTESAPSKSRNPKGPR